METAATHEPYGGFLFQFEYPTQVVHPPAGDVRIELGIGDCFWYFMFFYFYCHKSNGTCLGWVLQQVVDDTPYDTPIGVNHLAGDSDCVILVFIKNY